MHLPPLLSLPPPAPPTITLPSPPPYHPGCSGKRRPNTLVWKFGSAPCISEALGAASFAALQAVANARVLRVEGALADSDRLGAEGSKSSVALSTFTG